MIYKIFKTLICFVCVNLMFLPAVQAVENQGKVLIQEWQKALPGGKPHKKYFPQLSSLAFDGSRMFVGTHSGFLFAIDPSQKGKILWQTDTGGPIGSQPVTQGDMVFVGNSKGLLTALGTQDGQIKWSVPLGSEILGRPLVSQDVLYAPTTARDVFALNVKTGERIWKTSVKGYEKKITIRGNGPLVMQEGVLYMGFADGRVAALNAKDGNILWEKNFAAPELIFQDMDGAPLALGDSLYVSGYFGKLLKLSRRMGDVIWSQNFKIGTSLLSQEGKILATTSDGRFIGVKQEDGSLLWETPLHSKVLSEPVSMGKYVVAASESQLFVLDPQSGKIIQTLSLSGGFLGEALVLGNHLYILSGNSSVYSYQIL